MGKLLSMLEAEGRKKGLIRSGQTVDAKAAFALLKDMPYQRASTREPEAIIQEGRASALENTISCIKSSGKKGWSHG